MTQEKIGNMRIILGDCLEVIPSLVKKGVKVDSIITDPPYGIDYQSSRKIDKSKRLQKIRNDKKPFLEFIEPAYNILKDGGSFLCFTRWDVQQVFIDEIERVGFKVKNEIIWDKVIHGMGDLGGSFSPQHENIIFATKGNFKFPNKRPPSVLRFKRVSPDKLRHPNEKPRQLLEFLIEATTSKDDLVLDCFLGSGVCADASDETNRKFIGIEIDEHWYSPTVKFLKREKPYKLFK